MNYDSIYTCDLVNGIGIRVSLFVTGCRHHCKGCFNTNLWDFNCGKPFDNSTKSEIINYLKEPYITGLTLLGGEPMEPENQPSINDLLMTIKTTLPDKNVWMYSGFSYEQLTNASNLYPRVESLMNVGLKNNIESLTDSILKNIDVLVDGEFIESLKDTSLLYRGSSNQRIIDMQQTLNNNKLVLLNI